MELKSRANVDTEIRGLHDQIKGLTETVSRLLGKNDQLIRELVVCQSINKHLKEKVSKQYNRRNNVELAGIPNSIRDNKLEGTVINICSEHGIKITPMDMEACHRVHLSNAQAVKNPNQCKKVILNFVNCKHPERLLQL